ncbi:hypothetical protein FZEAL_1371 [Fusarium zealandicum]|uniref:Uncharacterized protein n=1 Tax=Fusarium zealandicum TaxID=1053134 RepID=A0A8H4UTC9_9HYPO|nr:hypothetical protein FZEAL_1371 [Fusarium zealandicum]
MSGQRDPRYVDEYGIYYPGQPVDQWYSQQQHSYAATQLAAYQQQQQEQPQQQQQHHHHHSAHHSVQGQQTAMAYAHAPYYPPTTSTNPAHQGSYPSNQQHEDHFDRVDFSGLKHRPENPRQRTKKFVEASQGDRPGSRGWSSSKDAKRDKKRATKESLDDFEFQFSGSNATSSRTPAT